MKLTPERINEIQRRLSVASPGPWVYERFEMRLENQDGDRKELWWTEWDEMFVADARQAIPELLQAMNSLIEDNELLKAENKELKEKCNKGT